MTARKKSRKYIQRLSPPLNLRRNSSLGSTARETDLIARHAGGPLDSSLQRSSNGLARLQYIIQSQGSLMSSRLKRLQRGRSEGELNKA